MLSLPTSSSLAVVPPSRTLSLSPNLPQDLLKVLPDKGVIDLRYHGPFILFAPKILFPPGTQMPKHGFIQQAADWLLLIFWTLNDAQRVVNEELPQLVDCTLVDWRQVQLEVASANNAKAVVNDGTETAQSSKVAEAEDGEGKANSAVCFRCGATLEESDTIYVAVTGDSNLDFRESCCSDCYPWKGEEDKQQARERVLSMLQMMAENDDVLVNHNILKKQLCLRYNDDCTSRKHADLWIAETLRFGDAMSFKKPKTLGSKGNKIVCLPSNFQHTKTEFPPEDLDTTSEVQHVVELLWKSDSWVTRRAVIESLQGFFASMQTPFARTKVFLDGYSQGKIFLAKGPFGQTLGLTSADAHANLELMTKKMKRMEAEDSLRRFIKNSADLEEEKPAISPLTGIMGHLDSQHEQATRTEMRVSAPAMFPDVNAEGADNAVTASTKH